VSIPDPKGRESWTPTDSPLHYGRFWGPREGAIVAFWTPAVAGVLVGEDHAPLRQYLPPPANRTGYTPLSGLFTIRLVS